MSKYGPTPWYELISDELRRELLSALTEGEGATSVHERFCLSEHCSLYTFRRFARERRPRNRRLAAAGEMVKALITDRDPHDFSELQLVALTRLVEALHLPGLKPSTIAALTQQINAFEKMALENHKDEREQQTHEMRLQIEAAKAKLADAARMDKKSGEKVVNLATVAKLLGEVDLQ